MLAIHFGAAGSVSLFGRLYHCLAAPSCPGRWSAVGAALAGPAISSTTPPSTARPTTQPAANRIRSRAPLGVANSRVIATIGSGLTATPAARCGLLQLYSPVVVKVTFIEPDSCQCVGAASRYRQYGRRRYLARQRSLSRSPPGQRRQPEGYRLARQRDWPWRTEIPHDGSDIIRERSRKGGVQRTTSGLKRVAAPGCPTVANSGDTRRDHPLRVGRRSGRQIGYLVVRHRQTPLIESGRAVRRTCPLSVSEG